ncbi:unnamed protein product [Adineta ricciae]|uniref:Uncharacterized protein n=1 Tax=Adineta ricciae TaxID=249248 RepID=A0A814RS81_ADIRI|nr:unnamed protein product [Adineta ricciae]
MALHIPKWVLAACVGAAPMLGIVFFILFSCTLLGLVQRCKISLAKSYAHRRKTTSYDRSSMDNEDDLVAVLFKPVSNAVIVSPFDDIPMKDIDADSSSKAYSEPKDGIEISIDSVKAFVFYLDLSQSFKLRRNRSVDTCHTGSDYDNGSSSIFNDNDYEQDRLSLIETSSQRRTSTKQVKSPDTIIHV